MYNRDFTCRYIYKYFNVFQTIQGSSRGSKVFQDFSMDFTVRHKYQKYIRDLKAFDWVQRSIKGF